MSRKKLKQTAKPKAKPAKAKRSVKFEGLTVVESMEKDFRSVPNKLIMQCQKNVAVLKQQEKKLKAQLAKTTAQSKIANTKQVALAKKATPAAKKQLIAAKKVSDNLAKLISQLTAEIAQIDTHCKALNQKQAKFTALNKQLAQFEKEFVAASNKKAAPKKRAKKAQPADQPEMRQESHFEPESIITANTTDEAEVVA